MIATAEPIWEKFLPAKALPNTGHKKFKTGQIWAVRVSSETKPYIFLVCASRGGSYFYITVLAGDVNVDFISENSPAAEHSVLLADPGELPGPTVLSGLSVPALGKFDFSPIAGSDHPQPAPKPTAQEIILRIVNKGEEHRKAGRNGQFSQVMVPMEDYQTLFDFFHVGSPPFDEVLVSTPIGIVSVYPVNPDGCTFTD